LLGIIFPYHLGPKELVEMVFNDIAIVGEEAMFNVGL